MTDAGRERAERAARQIVEEKWVLSEDNIPDLADIIERAGGTSEISEEFIAKYAENTSACKKCKAAVNAESRINLRAALRAGGQDAAVCAAKHSDTGANDPQDCDWPFCGCDPKADKVIEAIQESGFTLVRDEDLLKMTKDRERPCGETAWVSVEERLPEDGDSVLIFVPGWEDKYLRYRVAWIDYDVTPPQWVCNGEIVDNVTEWASLPSPPTAESLKEKI